MVAKPVKICKCVNPMLVDFDREFKEQYDPTRYKKYYLQEKYDGTRGILYKRGGKVVGIIGRNCKQDFRPKFPEIVAEAERIRGDFAIDGELTFFNEKGHPFFLTASVTKKVRGTARIKFMVWDILEYNGKSTLSLPLEKRNALLSKIIPSGARYIKVVKTLKDPRTYHTTYKGIVKRGGEGVVLKKHGSPYIHGDREHWLKIKKEVDADCIVCGYTLGTGRRKNIKYSDGRVRKTFGALILGQYHRGKLRYVGNVGVGLDDATLKQLYEMMSKMRSIQCPLDKCIRAEKWVEPRIVVEITYMERTKTGQFRLPVFRRIRTDKSPRDCTF